MMNPSDIINKEFLEQLLSKHPNALSERERRVVEQRLGLAKDPPQKFTEIGPVFGVTSSRAGQIFQKAMRKINYYHARYLRIENDDCHQLKSNITKLLIL